jgi:hypothetical protein
MGRKAVDHSGSRFERLIVLKKDASISVRSYWVCQCDCGKTISVRASHLLDKTSTSCGCKKLELISKKSKKHGHYVGNRPSPTYSSWSSMRDRCGSQPGYESVTICDRWNDFNAFLADMGTRPSLKHSIDRINPFGNYEPNNCRWATMTEQNRNKRNNHVLTYNNETLTITAWAERMKVPHSVLYRRAKLGWPSEKIITKPVALRSHSKWRSN